MKSQAWKAPICSSSVKQPEDSSSRRRKGLKGWNYTSWRKLPHEYGWINLWWCVGVHWNSSFQKHSPFFLFFCVLFLLKYIFFFSPLWNTCPSVCPIWGFLSALWSFFLRKNALPLSFSIASEEEDNFTSTLGLNFASLLMKLFRSSLDASTCMFLPGEFGILATLPQCQPA